MQGNIYEAMARAIEHTAVIVTFISKKYLLSANCNVEFKYLILSCHQFAPLPKIYNRYACRKNKPLVVVFLEENLELPEFVQKGIEHAPKFHILHSLHCYPSFILHVQTLTFFKFCFTTKDIRSFDDLKQLKNGRPMFDHIGNHIRRLGAGLKTQV